MSDDGPEIIAFEVTGGPTWLPGRLVQSILKADTVGPEETTAEIIDLCNAWAQMSYLLNRNDDTRFGWQVAEMITSVMKQVHEEACEEAGGEEALKARQDECMPELGRVLEQARADLDRQLAAHFEEEEPPQDQLWLW